MFSSSSFAFLSLRYASSSPASVLIVSSFGTPCTFATRVQITLKYLQTTDGLSELIFTMVMHAKNTKGAFSGLGCVWVGFNIVWMRHGSKVFKDS